MDWVWEDDRENEGNKVDFQMSGISSWVIGAIYQDEKSWRSEQVWGVKKKGLICDVRFEMPMR